MESKALTPRERIQELSNHFDISIRQMAQIANMSKVTFYHISDNSRTGISERTASRICYHFEKRFGAVVNRQWLLTGEGEMIEEEPMRAEAASEQPIEREKQADAAEGEEDYKSKYYALLERYSNLLREYAELLKRQ